MSELRTILMAAWKQASIRRGTLMAAGVAFYVFLALFPAMIAGLLSYGLFVSPETLARQMDSVADALPDDAASLITEQMESLANTSGSSLGIGLIVSVLVALWSASGGVGNLITAVNAMFGYTENRSFIKRKALALGLTLGAIVFLVLTVSLVAVAPAVFDAMIDVPGLRIGLEAARWILLVGVAIGAVGIMFRIAPDRPHDGDDDRRLISRGVIAAALMWVVVSVGFSLYVDNFGSYGKTYGALAGVVVLLLWLWAGFFAILFGASIEAIREDAPTDDLPDEVAEQVEQA